MVGEAIFQGGRRTMIRGCSWGREKRSGFFVFKFLFFLQISFHDYWFFSFLFLL